jgi:hypothetical protein
MAPGSLRTATADEAVVRQAPRSRGRLGGEEWRPAARSADRERGDPRQFAADSRAGRLRRRPRRRWFLPRPSCQEATGDREENARDEIGRQRERQLNHEAEQKARLQRGFEGCALCNGQTLDAFLQSPAQQGHHEVPTGTGAARAEADQAARDEDEPERDQKTRHWKQGAAHGRRRLSVAVVIRTLPDEPRRVCSE